ncbi:hypothetical protein GALL_389400 [mine drainage metagenome]|uniref:Uncharacterized protein n=1 Tax=mine drainage metagenome TaxID=410659 RepID=A0A1J5QH39_9ZZZZ
MRALTVEECSDVTGGMRGGSGNAFGGPRLLLPKDNHPETFDIDPVRDKPRRSGRGRIARTLKASCEAVYLSSHAAPPSLQV